MDKLLEKTRLLDFDNENIISLIEKKQWKNLSEKEKIVQIYEFVRDELPFAYNKDDAIPASMVLRDNYGQCNTKGILLMALLRAVNIPCRIHGFMIDKVIQKGAITGIPYIFSPKFSRDSGGNPRRKMTGRTYRYQIIETVLEYNFCV